MSEATADSPDVQVTAEAVNSVSTSEVESKIDTKDSTYPSDRENKSFPLRVDRDCWFYLNAHCRYGRNCKYRHPRFSNPNFRNSRPGFSRGNRSNYSSHPRAYNGYSNKFHSDNNNQYFTRGENSREPPQMAKSEDYSADSAPSKPRRYRVFTNSNRYAQQNNVGKPLERSQTSQAQVFHTEKFTRTVMNPKQPIMLSSVKNEDILRFRETEVLQLKKRYPNLEEQSGEGSFTISFSSSDPDWAFDLKSVILKITLPEDYPKEACDIKVVQDNLMPPMLLKYLNNRLSDWITERHKTLLATDEVELVLRPFFRWLDKNLEQLFIEGLRKVKLDIEAKRAGIEFVPFETLPGASNSSKEHKSASEEQKENIAQDQHSFAAKDEEPSFEEVEEKNTEKYNGVGESSGRQVPGRPQINGKKGTEIKLLNFELKDGAASLQCQKLVVTVRCTRCKTFNELGSLSKQKHHSTACPRCHQLQEADFQPSLLHAFSSVLGYLHLVGCQAVDLPMAQCSFYIACINCNKQNITDGIHYGQNYSTWCFYCNQKLCVSAHSAKFNMLQPIEKQITKVTNGWKKAREPLIEVGKPLPNNGTCKHYKKSYRWLRFPCCGKAYACDLCHNETEIDHEMKYATRMICGLCSKEQPYSKGQPCAHCSSMLTKKPTPHWEGGKGCRDKIKMCREDKQKYSGMNKTISKKAYALQPKKSKT